MPIQSTDNLFGVAKIIVDPVLGRGTHTTIASALTSASSGDTIFIRPGTYTENPTLKAGVNLAAFTCDAFAQSVAVTPNVTINGTVTATFVGAASISGICLQTNGANALSVTGSNATHLIFTNCSVQSLGQIGISINNANANIQFQYCTGDQNSTGQTFAVPAGTLNFNYCLMSNSGNSTTQSTVSNSATVNITYCTFNFPMSSTNTSSLVFDHSTIVCLAINAVAITITSTGSAGFLRGSIFSGSSACVVINTPGLFNILYASLVSTATNVTTGTGTLMYAYISYTNTGTGNNVSTSTKWTTFGS